MPLPEKLLFALPELAEKWSMPIDDLGMYAFEGILTLAVIVRDVLIVRGDRGTASHRLRTVPLEGVVAVGGSEVWPVFKGETVTLKKIRTSDGTVEELSEETRPQISLSDLYVRREEKRRFETENGIASSPGEPNGPRASGAARKAGAPTVILWARYWAFMCARIFNYGIPATKAELVRESLEWFANNTDHIPDERYLSRNIDILLAALRSS